MLASDAFILSSNGAIVRRAKSCFDIANSDSATRLKSACDQLCCKQCSVLKDQKIRDPSPIKTNLVYQK